MPFLLERLAARPSTPDGRREAFDESAAVAAQVQRILYSRNQPGNTAALIDWGLTHIVEIGSHDMPALSRYAEQARQAILIHEPRLKQLSVAVVPQSDPLTPAFLQISGILARSGEDWRIELPLME